MKKAATKSANTLQKDDTLQELLDIQKGISEIFKDMDEARQILTGARQEARLLILRYRKLKESGIIKKITNE